MLSITDLFILDEIEREQQIKQDLTNALLRPWSNEELNEFFMSNPGINPELSEEEIKISILANYRVLFTHAEYENFRSQIVGYSRKRY